MQNDPVLEHGTVLIIVGEQASGKTLLAKKLASEKGSYYELDHSLSLKQRVPYNMASYEEKFNTIIIDGFPNDKKLCEVKNIVTEAKNPPFFIITCQPEMFPKDVQLRRYSVYKTERNNHAE